jgi:hypothetical protein
LRPELPFWPKRTGGMCRTVTCRFGSFGSSVA